MNGPYCAGACGSRVSSPGLWCWACWVSVDSSSKTDLSDPICQMPVPESLEAQIIRHAHRLLNEAERADAIETLAHLIQVVQHQSLTNEQTPQQKEQTT